MLDRFFYESIHSTMSQYITLLNFTPQGLQNIHESPHRATAFKAAAKKAGAKVLHIFWTLGECDGAIIFSAKDDATATALTLSLSALGNVHTRTMRAFDATEFADIISKQSKM